ncbi:MAG: glucuronate isomerase [Acidobacteriota bacterium]
MDKSRTPIASSELPMIVESVVKETPVIDMHTHLYSAEFGEIGLWGLDELINYHYLVAEVFRFSNITYDQFWSLSKPQQAELIWRTLFAENSPLSEATRGVLTVLRLLGLNTGKPDLQSYREFFAQQNRLDYTTRVFQLSNVTQVVMTNDPFDSAERAVWMKGPDIDPRFRAVLRLDPLLSKWTDAVPMLSGWGYSISSTLEPKTMSEVRRFLEDWVKRIRPVYMAVSLPPEFTFPDDSPRCRLIAECVLPVCKEHGLPFSMMIGVRKLVNPALRLAGDSLGAADMTVVERICEKFPGNRFLVSMLARENQHALCVAARKFRNLLPFGCWWFMNNPSIIEEITRERLELLGTSFIPQHSDARVLDQLLYKWEHSRAVLAKVLTEKYQDLAATGWPVTYELIQRDVKQLFSGNFSSWISDVR